MQGAQPYPARVPSRINNQVFIKFSSMFGKLVFPRLVLRGEVGKQTRPPFPAGAAWGGCGSSNDVVFPRAHQSKQKKKHNILDKICPPHFYPKPYVVLFIEEMRKMMYFVFVVLVLDLKYGHF